MILVPAVLAPLGIVLQGHPHRAIRVAGLWFAVIAMVLPMVLELAGVIASSYRFGDAGITVVPQLTNLPGWFVLGFLTVANVSIVVLPTLFVGRLRAELSKAQSREQVRSWHLGRLGDDLLRAA